MNFHALNYFDPMVFFSPADDIRSQLLKAASAPSFDLDNFKIDLSLHLRSSALAD